VSIIPHNTAKANYPLVHDVSFSSLIEVSADWKGESKRKIKLTFQLSEIKHDQRRSGSQQKISVNDNKLFMISAVVFENNQWILVYFAI
jgi:hypothetical protein